MRFAGALEDNHSPQLFVRTPSGDERQITHVSGGAFNPAWSPDGARVVFERRGVRGQLYVVNADGSGSHQIASGCSKATKCLADSMPAWSRDGTQIAFVRDYGPEVKLGGEDGPSRSDLMVVPATGGAPGVLRHFGNDPLPDHPAWSPDGTKLVLPLTTAKQPTKQTRFLDALNVFDIASGAMRAITPLSLGASEPDWSADGSRIVFSSGAGHSEAAYVVRPDGSGLQKISVKLRNHSSHRDDPRLAEARVLRPRWSPDSTRIVFASDAKACTSHHIGGCPRGPERHSVFVMNADGSGVRRLTTSRRGESSPSWSPAG
jgi:TolB protein